MNLNSVRNHYLQIISFCSFFVVHVVRIPFDPNPHHDGLMYTAAIASSNGLFPHRDFFSQYGPLTSLIHGFWFLIAPNTLISLRFFNALLLAMVSFLLFQVLKKNIGLRVAFLVTLVWSISSPEILPAGLPWPSVISTLALLLAIYVVDIFKANLSTWVIFLVGAIVALALFARMHNLIIPVFVVLFSLLTQRYRFLWKFLSGYFSLITVALLFLHLQSALIPFIQQSILWPLFGHAGTTYGAKVLMVNALLLLQFPFFAYILWLICRFSRKNSLIVVIILASCLIAAYLYSRKIPDIPVSERSFAQFNYLSAFIAQQMPQMLTYGLTAVCLVLQLRSFDDKKCITENRILLSSISFGALFQLYPSPDAYHVWWIAPLLLIGIPASSKQTLSNFAKVPILVAIFIVNVFHVVDEMSLDRSRYQSSVLSGMYGNYRQVDEALLAIENFVEPRSAHFDCIDGLFAANRKGYLANDVLYVNWPQGIDNPKFVSEIFLVKCSSQENNVQGTDSILWQNDFLAIHNVK